MPNTNHFHRKQIKHFDHFGDYRELTFSCYKRQQLLNDDWRREQLSISIERALSNHGWKLTAFVYMPEHVHLLVFPDQKSSTISQLLFAIKRPFSYRIKSELASTNDPLLEALTIQQRPGKNTFRFWQEGPGYDRNINSKKALAAAMDYIHLNPVRRGLTEQAIDYRWSSARWYQSEGTLLDSALPTISMSSSDWIEATGTSD